MNELELTLGWVAKTVGGTLQSGDPELPVGDVLTDSRTLRAGDLFVALRGPRFDGHSFVAEVLDRGAAGAIVERDAGSKDQDPAYGSRSRGVIAVADTLRALQDLAHSVRLAAETRVIAITGSAGKTTTKETIAEMLATRVRVVKNKGNLNNHIGLPLSLIVCGRTAATRISATLRLPMRSPTRRARSCSGRLRRRCWSATLTTRV